MAGTKAEGEREAKTRAGGRGHAGNARDNEDPFKATEDPTVVSESRADGSEEARA